MADYNRFLALRGEWSDMVDHYLATDDGQFALYTLSEEDEGILKRMLLEYADLISPNKEAIRGRFENFRKETFMECFESLLSRGLNRESAEIKCIEIRNLARDMASRITAMYPVTTDSDLGDGISIPVEVERALDLALQPGFDPDNAIDFPQARDPFATKPAPDNKELAELLAKARRSDDPSNSRSTGETMPAEALIKEIKSKSLTEVQKAYSGTFVLPKSDPPPVHVSVHPASPPPAPEPGVELGIESSIPPPPDSEPPPETESRPTEPVEASDSLEDDQELTTGESELSDEEYNAVVDDAISQSGCFGPPSTPANQG